jgi:RNA polymerase sigma-70 factor, ECF subfamily
MRDRERPLRGLHALRVAVAEVLLGHPPLTPALAPARARPGLLLTEVSPMAKVTPDAVSSAVPPGTDDHAYAASSVDDEAEATRLIALVELARGGDAEAFGQLYDHYHPQVYRFLYYRVGSQTLAEDLTSDTFFRALRSMSSFRWQGKDFGAWLMTIARNLTTDHYKSGKNRLEVTTEDMSPHDSATEGPEATVMAHLTNETLMAALKKLPVEQQECLVMRFLQGLSISETAQTMGRSDGAIKQLQLRAVRNLAKLMPEGIR